ncbi:MAG: aspartate kinase [Zetaproteobacteria bacterium]|nr:aspartate kinase [Zetaproteobacteria bacterium]
MQPVIVQKYGGTSVSSPEKIIRICDQIAQAVAQGFGVVVVISAMGEFTDQLLALARSVHSRPPPRELDMLLTAGERVSMSLLSMALAAREVPAVSFTGSQSGILTDGRHGFAKICGIKAFRVREALSRGEVAIVAGYQGVCPQTKEVTTLGRGGSDLTAVAMAQHFQASKCEIYTDVEGVYSANPHEYTRAVLHRRINAENAYDLSCAGAQVLYSRCVAFAIKYRVPICVRSSMSFDRPGTEIVYEEQSLEKAKLIGFTVLPHTYWLCISGSPNTLAYCQIEQQFCHQGGEKLFSSYAEVKGMGQLTMVLREGSLDLLQGLVAQAGLCIETMNAQVPSLTVVGQGFEHDRELVAQVLSCVDHHPIFYAVRDRRMLFVFASPLVTEKVDRIHQLIQPD